MKKEKGQNLIELLVVLSILVLLISILLPMLQKARQKARRQICAFNLRQIAGALIGYADENDGILPRAYADDPGDPNKVWQIRLKNYIPLKHNTGYFTADRVDLKSVHCCPSANYTETQKQAMAASYGLNSWLRDPNWSYKLSSVRRDSEIILVGDMQEFNYDMVGTADGWFQWMWMPVPLPGFRHFNKANMAFVDGHVNINGQPLGYEELTLDSGHWKWWNDDE